MAQPAWDTTEAHASPPGGWQSTDEHTTAPGAVEQIGTSLKNQAKGIFDTLSSLVDPHIGQKIGDSLVDAQIEQWQKAKDEYKAGNYANAARRGLAAAIPLLGPLIENTAEKATTQDRPYEAAADILAMPAIAEGAEVVPAAARIAARVPARVIEMAKSPGTTTMAKGAAQATSGAGAVLAGHPIVGGGLFMKGWESIVKGMEERRAAQNAPPPLVEDLAQSLAGKRFDQLTPDAQAQIKQAASQIREFPKKVPPAPVTTTGPIDLGPRSTEPSKSIPQMIDEEIAARKAAAQTPPTPINRVPLWQQQGIQPAVIPEGPPNPTVAPEARTAAPVANGRPVVLQEDGKPLMYADQGAELPATVPSMPVAAPSALPAAAQAPAEALAAALAEEPPKAAGTPIHPPSEAYEGTYRAKRAQVIADRLHAHGITYEEASRLTPEHLTDSQWEAILGKDPETGVQYRKPSQKTLDQARVRLAHKYTAGRTAAATQAAQDLAEEMAQ